MKNRSSVSRSMNTSRSSSTRRRSTSQRRRRNSTSAQGQGSNRSSSRVISTPKSSRRSKRISSRSSIVDVDLSGMDINNGDEAAFSAVNSTTAQPSPTVETTTTTTAPSPIVETTTAPSPIAETTTTAPSPTVKTTTTAPSPIAETTTTAPSPTVKTTTTAPPPTVETFPFDISSDDEQHQLRIGSKTTKSGKMNKTDVLNYFTLQHDGSYLCKKCNQVYLSNRQSVTNLRKHLFVIHNVVGVAYDSQLAQIKQQIHQRDTLPVLPKARKEQLDKAILDCIIDDSLSFTSFQKSGMMNLIKAFDSRYKPPSRSTITSRVNETYHKYVNQLKLVLQKAPAVAFTCDIWKSGRQQYFVSLTAHLFDNHFESFPFVLSLRRFNERHLAVNVQSFLNYELDQKFKIPFERRMGITTDCGSEMVAATTSGVFGRRYACIAHVLNNVVKNGLCLWSTPDVNKFPIVEAQLAQGGESIIDDIAYEDDLSYDEAETSHQSADEDEHEEEEEEGEGEQDMDGNPSHSSVRMIPSNIVVRKKKRTVHFQDAFLSNDDDDDDDDDTSHNIQPDTRAFTLIGLLERTFDLLKRCRQLVSDMRNIGVVFTYVSTQIGRNGRGIALDMKIRWNTTFKMLDRLIQHHIIVDSVVRRKFDGLTVAQTNRMKLAALSPDDWDVLKALHYVLMGFDTATTIISASYYPTAADSYWAIVKLRQILNSNTNDSCYIDLFKKSALNYLEIYVQKHLSKEQQEGMLIAAFLDPEIHSDMNSNEFFKATELVKSKMARISLAAPVNMPSLPTLTTGSSKKQNAKQLMNRLAGFPINTSSCTTMSMSIDVEIALFINANKINQTFGQFWSANHLLFPRLVTLVHCYSLVPATSVCSESAFSIAGFIARKQRSSLSSRSLRHLLVLKYRKNLTKFQSEEDARMGQEVQYQPLSLNPAGSSSV